MFIPKKIKKLNLFVIETDLNKLKNILYDLKIIEFFKKQDNRFEKEIILDEKKIEKLSIKILELNSVLTFLNKYKSKKKTKSNPSIKEIEKLNSDLTKIKKHERMLELIDLKNRKIAKIKKNKIIDKVKNISITTYNKISKDLEKLRKELKLETCDRKFLHTKNISILSGYIESRKIKNLKKQIKMKNLNIEIEEIKILKNDKNIPTILNNPKSIESFEDILNLYSYPKFNEINPTFLIFLTFPLFFGFILGDVIYGLITLILFSLLKISATKSRNFYTILQFSAISSIIFGWIFGEFLGFEPHNIGFLETGTHYGFFLRFTDPNTLLVVAIIFGFIHITISYLLGFINELKHSLKSAIFNKLSWIILEIGILFFVVNYLEPQILYLYLGILISSISIIMIYIGHGFLGIIELPSLIINILSYARLMAIGISSIAIAILVNKYSFIFFEGGIFSIIGGILLFTIGHIFNLVLGNFEAFIQTLRLQYVESFSKFYQGEGKKFIPFGEKET